MNEILEKIFESKNLKTQPLSGGDINRVYKIEHQGKTYAVKANNKSHFPKMFEKEASGLNLLAENCPLKVPEVVNVGETEDQQYFVMEFIDEGSCSSNFWQDFGHGLADLHQTSQDAFGLDHNNYIGSLVQVNKPCETWQEFYITQRLEPMMEMALNSGEVNFVESKLFLPFFNRLGELYPKEKPSLVHGDLWSGNYLVDNNGAPVLIDPAVYFGHREMDIGMMHLFGGFDKQLFLGYNEIYPLEKNWEERIPYSQIYPLMVHVNLFGRSYWNRVEQILRKFEWFM